MGKNERFSDEQSAVDEYERCLTLLKKNCPSIYEGLLEGLDPLPTKTLVEYLRLLWHLVSLAPEDWCETDLDLENQNVRRQSTNAHLLKRLEQRSMFCERRGVYVIAQINNLRENAVNSDGSVAEAYIFAAHRLVCLVSSFLRCETGIRIVSGPARVVPAPRTCVLPPPPHLAKILPFRRPS